MSISSNMITFSFLNVAFRFLLKRRVTVAFFLFYKSFYLFLLDRILVNYFAFCTFSVCISNPQFIQIFGLIYFNNYGTIIGFSKLFIYLDDIPPFLVLMSLALLTIDLFHKLFILFDQRTELRLLILTRVITQIAYLLPHILHTLLSRRLHFLCHVFAAGTHTSSL